MTAQMQARMPSNTPPLVRLDPAKILRGYGYQKDAQGKQLAAPLAGSTYTGLYYVNLVTVASVPVGAGKTVVGNYSLDVPVGTTLIRLFASGYMKGPNEPTWWMQSASNFASCNGQRCNHWDSGTTLRQTIGTVITNPTPGAAQQLLLQISNLATVSSFSGDLTVELFS